jgi:hypothetical protein
MKTLFISVLGFLFLSSVCLAADEYVLVMSKDNDVCLHMGMMFNRDLKKYGAIRFDKHEEFNAIKWERKRAYRINEKGERDYGERTLSKETMLLSTFDINNDGTKEIVIKSDGPKLKGVPSDVIYVFKQQDSKYFDEFKYGINRNHDVLAKASIILGGSIDDGPFRNLVYYLKEIPSVMTEPRRGNQMPVIVKNSLGPRFFINPFLYKETYYNTMTGKHLEQVDDWLVIIKNTPDNEVQDVCYYLKAVDCKSNKSKGGRK